VTLIAPSNEPKFERSCPAKVSGPSPCFSYPSRVPRTSTNPRGDCLDSNSEITFYIRNKSRIATGVLRKIHQYAQQHGMPS